MTLIITQINKYGIIHASDSALTSGETPAGEGQKLFKVEYRNQKHLGLLYQGQSYMVHPVY